MSGMETKYPDVRPVISASKLLAIGGEKGAPGCERKLAGQYLWEIKQAESAALIRGSALHAIGEIYQNTGEVVSPESEEATIFQAGRHYLEVGTMAVEYEHEGVLPCGTPFIAYLDARDHQQRSPGQHLRLRDLKTCSRADTALVESSEDNEDMWLIRHPQPMFYAYLLLCVDHWFCPPLPSARHYGPKHWQRWVPKERCPSDVVALEWIYFRTKNRPISWVVRDSVGAEEVRDFYDEHLAPLVRKINLIYWWHEQNPNATIEELSRFEKNSGACKGVAMWCGPGENRVCDFGARGEPVEQLVQLRTKEKPMNAKERLAKAKAERAARLAGQSAPSAPAAPSTPEAPVAPAAPPLPEPTQDTEAETPVAEEAPPVQVVEEPAPKAAKKKTTRRGRPKNTTPAPTEPPADESGEKAGVNPPEAVEALANLPAADELAIAASEPAGLLSCLSTDQLLAEIFRRAGVSK